VSEVRKAIPVAVKLDERRVRTGITVTVRIALGISVLLSAVLKHWLAAAATFGILLTTLLPSLLRERLRYRVPPVFDLLTILFIFASLFLGEVHGYYLRFPWWDLLLHLMSGFLLGVLGFLLVYAINQKQLGNLGLKPAFIAIFAFSFALALGVLWEIFEFGMDQTFGLNMQKSGLADTMADLIVDTVGAATISLLGYGYLQTPAIDSFLERWIMEVDPHQSSAN
jgi:hypothetical protein